ncbi:MAG: signal transduction histidine kinase [Parvicellaceae bacterium]|jgi:signal transduction histidine kinase
MKIRTRLSLTFSFIASFIFIAFGVTIYFFSSTHRENEFDSRIIARVGITENFFLEKSSYSPEEYNKIKDQFLHTLPEETEEVIEVVSGKVPAFKYQYAEKLKTKMLGNNDYYFEHNESQGHSKFFEIRGKKYLVIVTAKDVSGLQNLSFLKYTILLLVCIGVPLVFLGSFLITKRALLPISIKIRKADKIGAESLHLRLTVHNPDDEIGELAIAFNRLLDRLQDSFDSQRLFISNASHEIRNPLTAIMGEAEVALSKARSQEEYVDSLQSIMLEAERLNSTVTNLLQLSKVSGKGDQLSFENIQFVDFIEQSILTYGFSNQENNISFNHSLGSQRNPALVKGNTGLLKTMLVNLLDNACKFSSNKPVEVRLAERDELLILEIIDSGIGISKKDLDNIKKPFYRGKNTLRTKGSGIGLTLTAKIIELHHGSLKIDSTLHEGTHVTVEIPRLELKN